MWPSSWSPAARRRSGGLRCDQAGNVRVVADSRAFASPDDLLVRLPNENRYQSTGSQKANLPVTTRARPLGPPYPPYGPLGEAIVNVMRPRPGLVTSPAGSAKLG